MGFDYFDDSKQSSPGLINAFATLYPFINVFCRKLWEALYYNKLARNLQAILNTF